MQTEPDQESPVEDEADVASQGVVLAWLVLVLGSAPVVLAIANDDWTFDASMGFLIALFSLKGLGKHYFERSTERSRRRTSGPTRWASVEAGGSAREQNNERSRHGSAVHGHHVWFLSRVVGLREALRAHLKQKRVLAPRAKKRKS